MRLLKGVLNVEQLRKFARTLDAFFETFAILSLLSMILIVTMQVITRKLFNFVFFWSEEMTLLLLVWFSFMGMAIGFREELHLGIDTFTDFFPYWFNIILNKVIDASIVAFGLYLVVYGWEFTVMMNESTLAATKLPNSVLYFVMPVTGFMTSCYAMLHLFGIDTKRHKGAEVEMGFELGEGKDGN